MQNEIEVGSVLKFFYDAIQKPCNVYTDGLPENFETPALYFPEATLIPDKHSNTEYKVLTAIQVKVFGDSDKDANKRAKTIIKKLFDNRSLVPIVLEDGSIVDGCFIKISKCDSRRLEDCVVLMSVEWNMNYKYQRNDQGIIVRSTSASAKLK